MSFTQRFKNWLAEPFSEDMSAEGWFLFIGLLICICIMWKLILYHLQLE